MFCKIILTSELYQATLQIMGQFCGTLILSPGKRRSNTKIYNFCLTSGWPQERKDRTTCLRYLMTTSLCPSLREGSSKDMSPESRDGIGFDSGSNPLKDGASSPAPDFTGWFGPAWFGGLCCFLLCESTKLMMVCDDKPKRLMESTE